MKISLLVTIGVALIIIGFVFAVYDATTQVGGSVPMVALLTMFSGVLFLGFATVVYVYRFIVRKFALQKAVNDMMTPLHRRVFHPQTFRIIAAILLAPALVSWIIIYDVERSGTGSLFDIVFLIPAYIGGGAGLIFLILAIVRSIYSENQSINKGISPLVSLIVGVAIILFRLNQIQYFQQYSGSRTISLTTLGILLIGGYLLITAIVEIVQSSVRKIFVKSPVT